MNADTAIAAIETFQQKNYAVLQDASMFWWNDLAAALEESKDALSIVEELTGRADDFETLEDERDGLLEKIEALEEKIEALTVKKGDNHE